MAGNGPGHGNRWTLGAGDCECLCQLQLQPVQKAVLVRLIPGLKVGTEELPEHGSHQGLGGEEFLSCEG